MEQAEENKKANLKGKLGKPFLPKIAKNAKEENAIIKEKVDKIAFDRKHEDQVKAMKREEDAIKEREAELALLRTPPKSEEGEENDGKFTMEE